MQRGKNMTSLSLEYMKEATRSIEVKYQQYINLKAQYGNTKVYCFFEGKDDHNYYLPEIKHYTDKEIIDFVCESKDNVYYIHGKILENKSDDEYKLFFVDHDFDNDNIYHDDIYCTPCYSIENFYMNKSFFEKFFRYELGIDKYSIDINDKEDYKNLIDLYERKKNKFIDDITPLNIWYCLQVNLGKVKEKDLRPKLTKLKEIEMNNIPKNIEELKSLTINYIEVTDQALNKARQILLQNPEYKFRGKYLKLFIAKFLSEVVTESNRPTDILSKRRKVRDNISKDYIIADYQKYAEIPQNLKEYLNIQLIGKECDKVI